MAWSRLSYVAGHSRGGTTWLGELISLHPSLNYIFEPFASDAHSFTGYDTRTLLANGRVFRPLKRPPTRVENPSPSFLNMDPDSPHLEAYRVLVRSHLRLLADKYFSGQTDYHLVIKQPRIENVGWVSGILDTDRVIIMDRHPFGVINSYRTGDFWSWMRVEWPLAQATVPACLPGSSAVFDAARNRYERLLVLSWVRNRIASDFCARGSGLLITYEELCKETLTVLQKAMQYIGVPWTKEYEARLGGYASRPTVDSGHFLETRRNSHFRASGWRRELPLEVIRCLTAFVLRHNLEIPVPGHGLAPISPAEKTKCLAHRMRTLIRRSRRSFTSMVRRMSENPEHRN